MVGLILQLSVEPEGLERRCPPRSVDCAVFDQAWSSTTLRLGRAEARGFNIQPAGGIEKSEEACIMSHERAKAGRDQQKNLTDVSAAWGHLSSLGIISSNRWRGHPSWRLADPSRIGQSRSKDTKLPGRLRNGQVGLRLPYP
jgi:hypothetical protein